jgi:hypothetical protein
MNTHITLVISAIDKKALQSALELASRKICEDDTMFFIHDDYRMTYELFDNETLKTFEVDPDEFLYQDISFMNKDDI